MPVDSSWNTPSVSPSEIILYTPSSSMGMSSLSQTVPPPARTISMVSMMTFSVRSPRKSIFRRPSASTVVMGNCVVITSSLVCSGQYSTTGSAVISTPAAWVDALRGMPSSLRAMSMSRRTASSFS